MSVTPAPIALLQRERIANIPSPNARAEIRDARDCVCATRARSRGQSWAARARANGRSLVAARTHTPPRHAPLQAHGGGPVGLQCGAPKDDISGGGGCRWLSVRSRPGHARSALFKGRRRRHGSQQQSSATTDAERSYACDIVAKIQVIVDRTHKKRLSALGRVLDLKKKYKK